MEKTKRYPIDGKTLRTSGTLSLSRNLFKERARDIPLAGRSEVLVCSGGPAGIAAALGAARSGAKVRLIELAGCLGGVWTAGLLTCILDGGNKTGIMKELLDTFGGQVYDPEQAKVVLEDKLTEAGVELRYHTMVTGAVCDENGRLTTVLTESKSGREAWTADCFVDCTGDGDLAAQAGCAFDVGKDKSCSCQPMSMMALLTGLHPETHEVFKNREHFFEFGNSVPMGEAAGRAAALAAKTGKLPHQLTLV
jgi:flavin-dependent dehydrogenase